MEVNGRHRALVSATSMLALYAATLPFQRLFQFQGVGSAATVAGALLAVTGLFAAAHLAGPPNFHPAVVCAALLTVIIVGGLGITELPAQALHPRVRGLAGADAGKTIQLLVVLGITWLVVDDRHSARTVAAGYVIGGHVAVAGNLADWASTGFDDRLRISGSEAAQANVVGLGLSLGIPLAWYVLQGARNRPIRLLMATYFISAPVGVFLTGSRTATATALAALLVVAVTYRRLPAGSKAAVAALAAVALMFLPPLLAGSRTDRAISGITTSEARELGVRSDLFGIAWSEMAEHPVFGGGRGVVREVGSLSTGDPTLSSHNSFLNIGAEYGIPALALYAAAWLLAGVSAARVGPSLERSVALTLWVVAVGGSLVVNFDLEKVNWFVLGMIVAFSRVAAPDEAPIGSVPMAASV